MSKRKVTLRLNNDVVEKAKKLGVNLSYFLEVKLVEYLALINGTPRGRFERAPIDETGAKSYGIPFAWIKHEIGSDITEPLYVNLLLDLIVFSIIVYFIITAYL